MRCPECQRNLEQFSISCSQCGWNLANHIDSDQPQQRESDPVQTSYDLHYRSAIEFLDQEEFAAALRAVNRAIADAHGDQKYEALAVRGYVEFKLGEHNKAIQDCGEAIESGWLDSRTYAWRAAALAAENRWPEVFDDLANAARLAGSDHERYSQLIANYLPQAEAYYAEELSNFPDSSLLLRQIGWVYYRAGIFDRGEKAFRKSIRCDDKDYISWVGLACTLVAQSKFKPAVVAATKAMHDPLPRTRWNALIVRVRSFHGAELILKKHNDLAELRRLAEKDSRKLRELGELKLELADPAGSLDEFRTALEIAPDYLPALLSRATAFERLGNHWLAVNDYTHYLRLRPGSQNALLARARSFLGLNDYSRAIEDATKALQVDSRDADAFLTRAEVFHAKQQYDNALNEVEHALRIDDRNAAAYSMRGKIEVGLCQFSSALESFSSAIEFADRQDSSRRAEFSYSRGTTRYELKQYPNAVEDFETATRLQPNHAGAWVWLAASRAQLGDWAKAIAHLQHALTIKPARARQYMLLGRSIAEQAVEVLTEKISEHPIDVDLVLNRGLAHQYLGNADKAIDDFTTVLDQRADDFETRTRRGQLLQKQEFHSRAIKDLSYVIHRMPDNHWARFCRALSWIAENKLEHAMSDIIKAIKTQPTQPRYHLLRGEIANKRGQIAKAIRAFRRAELLEPTNPIPPRLQGIANLLLGKLDFAIADLTRALELKSDHGEVYAYRGQAYLKKNLVESAQTDFDRAVRLSPKNIRGYVGRAEVLAVRNRLHEALLWLTKSLHRFPTHRGLAELLLARAKIFYQMGRYPQSIADFTSVLELVRSKPKWQIAARYGRALALMQNGDFDSAQRDLEKLKRLRPDNHSTDRLLSWIADRNSPRPQEIAKPHQIFRLVKPKVTRAPIRLNGTSQTWNISGPFDNWIVRDNDHQEYGPVSKSILDKWIEQGRIVSGMRILRSDWSKWKKAEKVYTQLID